MTAGVYLMLHKPSGCFFIGSAGNFDAACSNWRSRIRQGRVPSRVKAYKPNLADFEFHLLHECDASTWQKAVAMHDLKEMVLAECLRTRPGMVFNQEGYRPGGEVPPRTTRWFARWRHRGTHT